MEWSDLKSIVGKAAPVVGTLLGGPAGAAVGGLISAALGTENDPDSVSAALIGNPDALVKLQELQTNAKVQLQQLAVTAEENRMQEANKQYAAEAADRDSARQLAAKQPNDWVRPTLTIAVIAATIGVVFMVLLGAADRTLRDPVIAATAGGLVMYFLNESRQVLGFWFGTTRDEQTTTQAITQFAVTPGTVSAPAANAVTTTVSAPPSLPQSVSVTPAATEQPYTPTPGAQGDIYQGS